jgi:hypothetical protein
MDPVMSRETDTDRAELEAKLRKVEAAFENELRARGFDPAQLQNVALPGSLAKLYAQREQVRNELEELIASIEAGN